MREHAEGVVQVRLTREAQRVVPLAADPTALCMRCIQCGEEKLSTQLIETLQLGLTKESTLKVRSR